MYPHISDKIKNLIPQMAYPAGQVVHVLQELVWTFVNKHMNDGKLQKWRGGGFNMMILLQ